MASIYVKFKPPQVSTRCTDHILWNQYQCNSTNWLEIPIHLKWKTQPLEDCAYFKTILHIKLFQPKTIVYVTMVVKNHPGLREGFQKKTANYPYFVDKRLSPPPYPHRPKLIIFTLRNFFIHIRDPPPRPYQRLSKLMRYFFIFF